MQTQQLQGVACLPPWLAKDEAAGQLLSISHVHGSFHRLLKSTEL